MPETEQTHKDLKKFIVVKFDELEKIPLKKWKTSIRGYVLSWVDEFFEELDK